MKLARRFSEAALLAELDEVFLLDFGLAKSSAGQMPTIQASRSVRAYPPVYAPLEQIHGRGTDPRSDFYALGATLHHLLTGQPPLDAPTRFEAVENDQPDPLIRRMRSDKGSQMRLACTTCMAMFGSGAKIGFTRATTARQRMEARG